MDGVSVCPVRNVLGGGNMTDVQHGNLLVCRARRGSNNVLWPGYALLESSFIPGE